MMCQNPVVFLENSTDSLSMTTTNSFINDNPKHALRTRYTIALLLIATISLTTHYGVQRLIVSDKSWGEIINIAGRQRMLSQRIAKSVEMQDYVQLNESVDLFESSHEKLVLGRINAQEANLPSQTIQRMFTDLEDSYQRLVSTTHQILDLNESGQSLEELSLEISRSESTFLPKMNQIVKQYEIEAAEDSDFLLHTHQGLTFLTLLVLAIEFIFVFEPLSRRLKRQWVQIKESELRYELAVGGSKDAIWDWDLVTNTIYYSPRWAVMFQDERLIKSNDPNSWLRLVASSDISQFNQHIQRLKGGETEEIDIEIAMMTCTGRPIHALCRGTTLKNKDGKVIRLAGSLADISEQYQARESLRKLAERDSLTGLANRSFFYERVELAVSRSHTENTYRYAVLYLDFDGFKSVNDALGHNVGDELLVSISKRMTESLPENAVIARLGGDEFAVLLTDSDHEESIGVCELLLESLKAPHSLSSNSLVSTASIGVVLGEERFTDADTVLRDADSAMYEAKENGKSQFQLFDIRLHESALKRLSLESSLHAANIHEDFKLLYQPIVDLESGVPEGVEVLVRWNKNNENSVGPDVFIPIMEEIGLITALGEWILRESAQTLRRWDSKLGNTNTIFHVNVSKIQIIHPGFMDMLRDVLSEYPDLESRLVLEITETAVMDPRSDVLELMESMRDCGYLIAMDDFGTGHSSLSCLHQFPLDILKIDRSFILNLESKREFSAVYHSIVTLAQNLGLSIVAEGVETIGQISQLQTMGCMFGQGYYFARPLEEQDALQYLGHEPDKQRAA